MKFVASPTSPYGFRLRLACRLKGLDLPFESPPATEQRKALSPFGLIPMLVLGDGTVLVESLALLDWLEDSRLGQHALRPADAVLCARIRMIGLLFDQNVLKALGGVFVQVVKPAPDADAARRAFDDVTEQLAKLAHFLDPQGPAVGGAWSIADCAMAPFVLLMEALAPRFEVAAPSRRVERFAQWWRALEAVPEAAAVFAQQRQALAALLAPRPSPTTAA